MPFVNIPNSSITLNPPETTNTFGRAYSFSWKVYAGRVNTFRFAHAVYYSGNQSSIINYTMQLVNADTGAVLASVGGSNSYISTAATNTLDFTFTPTATETLNLRIEPSSQSGNYSNQTLVSLDTDAVSGNKFLFRDGTDIKKFTSEPMAVPAMTSNTAPSGIASANSIFSAAYDAWKAFDRTTEFWNCANGSQIGWLAYEFPAAKVISSYAMTSASSSGDASGAPKSWTFEGSNDGTTWTVLDTRASQVNWTTNESRTFAISNQTAYKMYRINITATKAGTFIAIQELQMAVSTTWLVVGQDPATKAMFDSDGMTDLSIINNAAIQALISATPDLLVWTDETGSPARSIKTTAVPNNKLVLPVGDLTVGVVDSLVLSVTQSGATDIKVLASGDGGVTWKSNTAGTWQTVDISNLANVKSSGMMPVRVKALLAADWAGIVNNGKLRFAYYMEQVASTDTCGIDKLEVNNVGYTSTPILGSLSVLYNLLQAITPDCYVSRDDGVTWKKVTPDVLTSLEDLPAGNKLRVKAVLTNGLELQGLSYAWI